MGGIVKRASKNIIWGMGNKIIIILFPFVIRTVMIYKLGKMYIGLDSLFVSILQVLCLADLGMDAAVVFCLYEPLSQNDIARVGGILSFYKKVYRWLGIFIFFFGISLMPFFDLLIKGDYPRGINIYIIYLLQLLNVVLEYWLFAYKNALLIALERVDLESKIRMIINVMQYIVQIAILLVFSDYYLYVIIFPLSTIIQNIMRNHIVNKIYSKYFVKTKIRETEKKLIISKVKALFVYKLGGVILRYADQLVISSFLGLAVLGKYSNYYYVVSTLIGILGIYYSSIRPLIGNSFIQNSKEKNLILFDNLQKIQLWIIGWCSICLVCLFQDFIFLWAGNEFLLDFVNVILFAVYFYIWKIQDIVYVFKEATGLWDKDKIRPICSAILNLLINLILVQIIGLHGVLFSTIVSISVIDLPWSARIFFKQYFRNQEKKYYLDILKYTILTLCIGCITYNICGHLDFYSLWFNFVLKIVICILIPNLFYAFFIRLDKIVTKR